MKIKTHEALVCSGQQWALWAIKFVFVIYREDLLTLQSRADHSAFIYSSTEEDSFKGESWSCGQSISSSLFTRVYCQS